MLHKQENQGCLTTVQSTKQRIGVKLVKFQRKKKTSTRYTNKVDTNDIDKYNTFDVRNGTIAGELQRTFIVGP